MKLLVLLLVTLIIPLLCGIPFHTGEEGSPYSLLPCWCAGWTVIYTVTFAAALPGIFLGWSLTFFTGLWMLVISGLSVISVITMIRQKRNIFRQAAASLKEMTFYEAAAALMAAGHAAVTFLMMHVDDDDIAYVAAVTTSVDTNSLMKYDAISGYLIQNYSANDMNRLVSAPLFAFYAALSKLSGIRPAALCHSFLPPVYTVLFFAAVALAGAELYGGDRKKTGLFTCLAILVSAFSYVSVYTAGTFLMIRSWQGKAQIVGFIMPFLFYIFLRVLRRKDMGVRETLLLVCTLGAASLMTTMGAFLAVLTAAAVGCITAFVLKKPGILMRTALSFLIPAASALIYFKL